jgi:Gas vesicle synthesis protein GvpL/GvpF
MATTGVYVYGFVRTADAPELGCIGLMHEGTPARVYAVSAGPVAGMVSHYDGRGRVLPLRRNLDPHERVIRETLRHTTILPAAFGHVARDAPQVAAMLRRHAAGLVRELTRLDAKVEMAVRVAWDVENIFTHLVGRHPELAALRDRIFAGGRQVDVNDKIELGRLFEERREAGRADVVQRVVDALRPHAAGVHVSGVHGEKAAADLAFLVGRDDTQAFRDRVLEVAADWPADYAFRCSGPWAPFNFVQLDIDGGRAERRGAA